MSGYSFLKNQLLSDKLPPETFASNLRIPAYEYIGIINLESLLVKSSMKEFLACI
jgi:hypothetical protein